MSWDVLIFNYEGKPPLPDEMAEAPEPKTLGSAAEVRERITAHWPDVTWSTPTSGIYEGAGFAINVDTGKDDPLEAVMLHVHGAGDAVSALFALAIPNGWSLYDCSTDEFLDPEDPEAAGWDGFQKLRNKAVSSRQDKTPKTKRKRK